MCDDLRHVREIKIVTVVTVNSFSCQRIEHFHKCYIIIFVTFYYSPLNFAAIIEKNATSVYVIFLLLEVNINYCMNCLFYWIHK